MAKSFHELSSRTQMIVFGCVCVLALAGAWQVSIGPDSAELETRRAKLAKLESEIVRVQAIADKLPELQREVKTLAVALRETTAALPEEKDPQDVLRNFHDIAAESALDISSSSPAPSSRSRSTRSGPSSWDSRAAITTSAGSSTGWRPWPGWCPSATSTSRPRSSRMAAAPSW